MADNTTLNTGTGGDLIATDDIGGVKYQRVKLVLGADGVNDGDASAANPIPVTGGLTNAQLRAAAVPVDATGELIEAIEAMRYAIQALTRSVGLQTVDAFGRNRVVLDALGGAQTLGTITTVTGVTTLTNQAQLGGLAAQDQIPALMHMQADNLRRNITTS